MEADPLQVRQVESQAEVSHVAIRVELFICILIVPEQYRHVNVSDLAKIELELLPATYLLAAPRQYKQLARFETSD